MNRYLVSVLGLAALTAALVAQTPPVTGDRTSPLRELGGEDNIGISNAVLRNQPEVRVLRVVVEPGGVRAMHSHDDVDFHLFAPISGTMELTIEGEDPIEVTPWHPYYLDGGTQHGFHNPSDVAIEIMETFVQ
ncbi:MAG: cupin domain-containing protein [Gammaproteobacteria bacterium]|nr:cupin domain-containing protein [Gammaproteobacteria bacterium]MDE0246818.1 cupin domain-containing protein [Gammaproteobacteria bacterium]